MYNGFKKGIILGGLVGVSLSYLMGHERHRNRPKRMMRAGKDIIRKTGTIFDEVLNFLK